MCHSPLWQSSVAQEWVFISQTAILQLSFYCLGQTSPSLSVWYSDSLNTVCSYDFVFQDQRLISVFQCLLIFIEHCLHFSWQSKFVTQNGCFFLQNRHFEFFCSFLLGLLAFPLLSKAILLSLRQFTKQVTDPPQFNSCINWIHGFVGFKEGGR